MGDSEFKVQSLVILIGRLAEKDIQLLLGGSSPPAGGSERQWFFNDKILLRSFYIRLTPDQKPK